jgi:hypothetical protein
VVQNAREASLRPEFGVHVAIEIGIELELY